MVRLLPFPGRISFARGGAARGGFTLVELLVVVAVIGLLASMLLGSINVVRKNARSSVCRSNLRQFALAFLAYPVENEDRWPIGEWQPLVQEYIDGGIPTCLRITRCPAVPTRATDGSVIGSTYSYTGVYWASWNVGPIFNDPQQFLFAWPFWIYSPHKVTIAQTRRTGEKCVLSERWDNSASSTWGTNQLNDQGTSLAHTGSSNFMFVDGHVQAIAVTGIKQFAAIQWAGDAMWRPYNSGASAKVK